MKQKITICTNCKHLVRGEGVGKEAKTAWWNLFCGKTERPTAINPINGKKGWQLNDGEFTDNQYDLCQSINDGNCKDFEKSKTTSPKPPRMPTTTTTR